MNPFFPADNIKTVLEELDLILHECLEKGSVLGYFPALYRAVTERVLDGIEQGRFEEGKRMEVLDTLFANRYLIAYRSFAEGQACSEAWKLAFEQAQTGEGQLLLHLLLGMNAHITLDLGIAAADTSKHLKRPVEELKRDFREINVILGEMLDEVQAKVNQQYIEWKWIDILARKWDEWLAKQLLKLARAYAWRVAKRTYYLKEGTREKHIQTLDIRARKVGRLIQSVFSLSRFFSRLFPNREPLDVQKVLQALWA